MKIYCASDLNIGYECVNYPKILSFLELVQKNADQLILCGDIFDLWVNEFDVIKTQEPMKSCFNVLVETSKRVPTIVIWGNHDYNLASKTNLFIVSDSFLQEGIFFSHGWRFDLEQRSGYPFYGWIIEYFPWIYQKFFKTPFQVIDNRDQYTEQIDLICQAARRFVEKNKYKYVVFGHTHYPIIWRKNSKLWRYG